MNSHKIMDNAYLMEVGGILRIPEGGARLDPPWGSYMHRVREDILIQLLSLNQDQ